MSNVYILPRRGNSTAAATAATGANQQQQQRHQQQLLQKPVHQFPTNQPQIVVVGGSQGGPITRSLPALPGHKPGSRFVRSTAQLGSSQIRNSSSSRLFSQPHPSRLPMTAARRVYMATPATKPAHQPQHVQIVQHNQPSMLASHSRRAQLLKKAAAAQMVIVDQSEEDEFDVDEVYQLLEESAGHRMTDEAALPRRRERLTNLTAEEKMDRRKQKNRIAAQAARDRKKETTKKLEDSLKRALLEIGKLKNEVKALRSANAQLADENHGFEGGKSAAVELAYGRPQQQFHQAHGPEDQNFVDLQELKPATTNYPPMHHSHQPIVHQGQYQHQGQPKMRPMQQRVDSLGSAESFSGPQQRERETAQQQRQQPNWPMAEMEVERASEMVLPSDRWRRPVKMGNKERSWRMACFVKPNKVKKDVGKWIDQKWLENGKMIQKMELEMPISMDSDSDGIVGNGAVQKRGDVGGKGGPGGNCAGGDDEDIRLQQIFDELFEELEVPIDVDRFCNEIIEEGIAAQNVDNGACQAAQTVQMSATPIGGTFVGAEGGESEGPRPAEIVDPNGGYQQQYSIEHLQPICIQNGFPNGIVDTQIGSRGNDGVNGGGHCAPNDGAGVVGIPPKALSPHNYFAPAAPSTTHQQIPFAPPQSPPEHYHQNFQHQPPPYFHQTQQHYSPHHKQSISSSDSQSDNGFISPSPFQMVPSPVDSPYLYQSQPLSTDSCAQMDYANATVLQPINPEDQSNNAELEFNAQNDESAKHFEQIGQIDDDHFLGHEFGMDDWSHHEHFPMSSETTASSFGSSAQSPNGEEEESHQMHGNSYQDEMSQFLDSF